MYQRNRQDWMKHADFILIDILCLQVAFILGYHIRHGFVGPLYGTQMYQTMAVVLAFADLFVAAVFNTMHNVVRRGVAQELVDTFKHAILIFAVAVCYMFSLKNSDDYSRVVIYITAGIHLVLGYAGRICWKKVVRRHIMKKENLRSMLVVTDLASVHDVLSHISSIPGDTQDVSGLILTDGEAGKTIDGVPVKANIKDATQYICKNWVDEIFIDPRQRSEEVELLVAQCRKMGVTIHEAISLTNDIGNRQFLEKVGSYQVVTSSVNLASPVQIMCKRLIDIAAGLAGLAATGLILLFVGPKIKKASPGPIFFKQDRVGKNGRIFKFVKIRSMYLDAEERKKDLMAQNRVADGMMFKMDFDPRIIGNEVLPDGSHKTGIGQFIRNTSLDEFPQFWNVLKGDMSLVGTRPPTVDEWEKYDLHHRARLAMKPGITGMWQVSGRSDITDFEEVVRLDTEYIYNWSLLLDFKIIFKTFAVLFKKEGAM